MKLKPIYNYLGSDNEFLNAMQTDRCSGSGVGANGGAPSQLLAGAVTTSAGNTGRAKLVALASDKYMIIYQQAAAPSDLLGVICNVDTTTLTVTVNTPVTISTVGTSINFLDCKLLTTDRVAVNYVETGTGLDVVSILTVSGNTFTVGAANSLGTVGTVSFPKISVLTSTTLLHTYSNNRSAANVLTVADDVVTAGAETASPVNTTAGYHLARLSNTSGLLATSHNVFSSALFVLTVSGGVVTYNTPFSLQNPVFQSSGTDQYVFEVNSTGIVLPIIARSIFESPPNAMMRVIIASGGVITSDDSSEYYTSGVPIASDVARTVPMTNDLAAFVLVENDVNKKLYCGAVQYASASIVTEHLPVIINSGTNNFPDIAKLSSTLMAWVSHDNSNNTKTGVVKIT